LILEYCRAWHDGFARIAIDPEVEFSWSRGKGEV